MNGQERLVAASQALELQHLQELIRGREKEFKETVARSQHELDKSRQYTNEVVSRNQLLEAQIEELTLQLRTAQNKAIDNANNNLSSLLKHAEATKGSEKLVSQQHELREAHAACARLTEEREVLLEKLVYERDRVVELEQRTSTRHTRHASIATQTETRPGPPIPREDYRTMINEEERLSGKDAIEFLRHRIEMEQLRVNESQDACAFHSANIVALHDRLQSRIQGELTKLQTEQDQYSRLMSNYQSVMHNTGVASTPRPVAPAVVSTPTPRRDFANAQQALFQKQEGEMQNLRRRLQELQTRQDQVGGHNNSSSMPSPIQHSSILQRMLMNATSNN